jgi:stage III sporulation protein AB
MGFYFSNEMKERIDDLKELRKLIGLLRGDIRYAATPLPEAISVLNKRHEGRFHHFWIMSAASYRSCQDKPLQLFGGRNRYHAKQYITKQEGQVAACPAW